MFHWAPPEVSGLGVMTTTSSRMRSSQVCDVLGVAGADGEGRRRCCGRCPCARCRPSPAATMPGSTSRSTSGHSASATTSAGQARRHGAALVAGRAVGLLELDARARLGGLEQRDDLRVRLARRGVGDERQRAGRRLEGRRRGVLGRRGHGQGAEQRWPRWRCPARIRVAGATVRRRCPVMCLSPSVWLARAADVGRP